MRSLKGTLLSKPGIENLALFRRQYLQRLDVKRLTWPKPEHLQIYRTQKWIWDFVAYAQEHLFNAVYDLAFLKALQIRIEQAVEGTADPDVFDAFAETYVSLSSSHVVESIDQYTWVQYTAPWESLDPSRPETGIQVLEKPNVLAAAGSTGHRTWEAALELGGWLGDGLIVSGKRVLELGCGTGFLSLLAAQQGAMSVTATDGDPHLVGIVSQAAERNGLSVRCKYYEWSGSIDSLEEEFDVVFAADVTYDRTAIKWLVRSLTQLVRRMPKIAIWVCATKRNESTLQFFRDKCHQSNLKMSTMMVSSKEHSQRGFFHKTDVDFVTMIISEGSKTINMEASTVESLLRSHHTI